ncbi:MAG: phosphate/phosphite/phosphonate ABC transporter substrate-binding protein [bacterium]
MSKRSFWIPVVLSLVFALLFLDACKREIPLGSAKNPIKMYFVPSAEVDKVLSSGKVIADYLEKETRYKFKTAVPTSYAAVIEAMGTKEADIAWLATFAYVVAHEKYGVDVALKTVRFGDYQYRGQIIARADSGIKELKDVEGKKVAYTDAASTSGFIYPSALFAKMGIKPGETFFAGGHPQVVLAVYEGTADVGCTYWSPPRPDGSIGDARRAVLETHPDVAEKVVIIGYTDWIPNDTVSFRKDFPKDMRDKIVAALLKYAETEEGKKALGDLYNITGLTGAKDSDYDVVRESLKALGKTAEEYIGK